MKLTHRQIWILFLTPLLVTAGVVVADTAFLVNDVGVQNEIGLGTHDDVLIHVEGDFDIELSGDWARTNHVRVNTSKGNMSVRSTGESNGTVLASEINGTWTNITNIQAPSANVTFNPEDKDPVTVRRDIDSINFTQVDPSDEAVDLIYSRDGSQASIKVGNLTPDEQYMFREGGEAVDVAVANSKGRANFTDPPDGEHTVTLDEAGSITVRRETANYTNVSGDCRANVRFYEDTDDNPVIAEKTDSDDDGNISVVGLPVDTEFVISAKCQGYHNRTAILPDIGTQKNVYLLNKSRDTSEVEFRVDDRTGEFGRDAELIIQKAIDRSKFNAEADGFAWVNIGGDDLGAAGSYVIQLETGDRYRIKIQNDRGDERLLGTYVPQGNAIETLVVGRVEWASTEGNATIFNASIKNESSLGNEPPVIQIQFVNPANLTESPGKAVENFNFSVYEAGNRSNEIGAGSASGDLGTFYAETNITDDQTNKKWIVEAQYVVDGEEVTQRRVLGGASVDIQADQDWLGLFALLIITSVGLLYGRRTTNIGIVMMWMLAGLAMILQVINISVAWYIVSGFIVAAAVVWGEMNER